MGGFNLEKELFCLGAGRMGERYVPDAYAFYISRIPTNEVSKDAKGDESPGLIRASFSYFKLSVFVVLLRSTCVVCYRKSNPYSRFLHGLARD
jgi:hypothetical protein